MPQRVNGSVFSDQVLTGSLKHYLLIGADFSDSFDGEAPVYGSAAEEVARVITQRATIAIFNPYEIGISFALESNRANWETEDLEQAIRDLGSNVGTDGLDLSNIRLTEVEYKFLGSDYVFVVPDPTINSLMVNNTYFAASEVTLTLPDYTQDYIEVGSVIRVFKYEDIEVTIEAAPGQSIRDLTREVTSSSYSYTYNEEIAIVFDGIKWAVYHDDKETIDLIIGLQSELDSKQNLSEKAQPNGYASLDSSGLVPASQLPSYVDDVLEYQDMSLFPNPGEFEKIYVDLSTSRIYRWSGSSYIELSTRPPDTDEVPEGTSNLYFTTQRARDSVSAGTGVTYNPSTGVISIGQPVGTTDDVTFNTVTADIIGDVTGNVTGQVSDISNHDTDELTEGTSNLYFTSQRARSSVSAGTGVTYNSSTGVISIGQPVGTTDDVTFNTVTADIFGDVTGQVSDISNHDTDDLSEGTSNLYFTTQRARNSVSAGTGVTYNPSTGVISIGQPVGTTDDVTFNQVTADVVGQVSDISNHDTDDLSEGSGNLYFTQSRARNSVSAGTGVSYNTSTGVISVGQSVGTSDNVTFNQVTADVIGNLTGDVTGQVSDISNHTTDDLAEGTTNLYYTEERTDDRISQLLDSSADITLVYDDNGNALTIGTTATEANTAERIVKRSADNDFNITAINLDTTDTSTRTTGRLRWNSDIGGPEIGLDGNDINLQIGQETLVRVYNETGTDIAEGQVVRISGSNGTRITVDLPQATPTFDAGAVLGVATETIVDASEGFVTSYGRVNNIDTSAYSEGDRLYLSQTTPGGLTNLVPPAPNKRIYIGVVVRSLAVGGAIFVQPGASNDIADISDVEITNIQDNQTLIWDTDRFVNATPDGLYTPADHASTHLPNGSDPLVTESASTISAISNNTEGNANSFARSDHTHNISTGAPSTQRPEEANAEGTSNDLARADHVHRIAAASAVTTSSNTNTQGTANSFARSDHTHQLSTNTPTNGQFLTWNGSEWVATTLDIGPPGVSYGQSFGAFDFEFTNNTDWVISSSANRIRDPINQSIRAFAFDDTVEEGLGFFIEVPPASANLTNITYTFWVKRRSASSGSNAVFRAHNRPISSNVPVGTWNSNADFPTITGVSTVYQRVSFTVPLSTAGFVNDTLHQIEITRNSPNGSDDVQGDILISRVKVSFS